MTEQEEEEDENKRIRPRERARGQKNVTSDFGPFRFSICKPYF